MVDVCEAKVMALEQLFVRKFETFFRMHDSNGSSVRRWQFSFQNLHCFAASHKPNKCHIQICKKQFGIDAMLVSTSRSEIKAEPNLLFHQSLSNGMRILRQNYIWNQRVASS
jgi:hypothetical protein